MSFIFEFALSRRRRLFTKKILVAAKNSISNYTRDRYLFVCLLAAPWCDAVTKTLIYKAAHIHKLNFNLKSRMTMVMLTVKSCVDSVMLRYFMFNASKFTCTLTSPNRSPKQRNETVWQVNLIFKSLRIFRCTAIYSLV